MQILFSFLTRYGITILLSIVAYNTLSSFPPLSYFDGDKRTISKLNKQIKSKDETILSLNELKVKLSMAISEQNKLIRQLELSGQAKQNEIDSTFNELNADLAKLKNSIINKQVEINTCQDAIDYLIGLKD